MRKNWKFRLAEPTATTAPRPRTCTKCGNQLEELPMMPGVCYGCYRDLCETHTPEQIRALINETQSTQTYISGGEIIEYTAQTKQSTETETIF